MTDLDELIRSTLRGRIADIDSISLWTPPTSKSHRRGWIPLVAAAIVLLIVGTVVGVRSAVHGSHQNAQPAALAAPPIPKGMKAIDALGLEVLVPSAMPVDKRCAGGLSTPLSMIGGVVSCALGPSYPIDLSINTVIGTPAPGNCVGHVTLGQVSTCIVEANDGNYGNQLYVLWHGVIVNGVGHNSRVLTILKSLHTVVTDRNGCAGVMPLEREGQGSSAAPSGRILNPSALKLQLCWYGSSGLWASVTLEQPQVRELVSKLNLMPRWITPVPPFQSPCRSDPQLTAILFSTELPDGLHETAFASGSTCPDEQTISGGATIRELPTASTLIDWAGLANR